MEEKVAGMTEGTRWERFKRGVKRYLSSLLDMRSDMLTYEELNQMMEENTVIHGSNMWILMMAILIASIGLNVNSTAVIIGAMLISPLMSGILTMGYSLAIHDLTMLKRAAGGFATQVVISLVTSTLYFTLTPLTAATSEMIARTSPTLWDVLIALFGGIAGGIGNTRKKASNVIPGVAIATALMPPLCTVGYGLATRQLSFIIGAFYLFAINTLFIALSAFFVTKLLRVPARQELDEERRRHANRIIRTLIVVTVVPSILTGALTVYKSVLEGSIQNYLDSEFVFENAQLVQSDVDTINRRISVSLVGEQLSDERIAELEAKLGDYNLSGFTLHVLQNTQLDTVDDEKVTIAVQENTIRELGEQLEKERAARRELEAKLDSKVDSDALAKKVAEVFADLNDVECGVVYSKDGSYVLVRAGVSEPISDGERDAIISLAKAESGIDEVRLELSEGTGDAIGTGSAGGE